MISFKTLVRIAALAAGLALGSPSQAGVTLTFPDLTCNGMSMTDQGNGNFTVNCLQLACTATASPTTQIPGNPISVTASCSGVGGVNLVWTPVAGNDPLCPANVTPTNGQSPLTNGALLAPANNAAVANCSYKVVGTDASFQTGTKTITANWAVGAPPAPTGCSVSASPTSLPTGGGSTVVTVNCTGTPATNWVIKKNGSVWQSPAGNNVTQNDTLPANGGTNAVTYTYTAVPSNGATSGTANASNNIVSVAGSGGGGGGSCSTYGWSGGVTNIGDFAFDSTPIVIALGKGDNDVAILSYTATAADSGKQSSIAISEYGSSNAYRTVWMSKNRCEMTGATKVQSTPQPQVYIAVNATASGSPSINMQPGETWYIMVRNWRFTSSANTCQGAGTPPCPIVLTPYRWQ